MRTVLLTSVAAVGLAWAAGAMAQTPAPASAPAPAASPEMSAPAAPAAPAEVAPAAPDQAAPAPDATPAPKPHRAHRMHHVSTASSPMSGGGEHWSHEPGTGESGPASSKASNITEANTHSDIAPHLPQPAAGESGTAETYLQEAQSALRAHKTGAAQQALEMAQTRLMTRSMPVSASGQPDPDAAVQQVATARKALASGDMAGANSAISAALAGSGK